MKAIEEDGGVVVNGNFTRSGEPDLQCGYPVYRDRIDGSNYKELVYLAVEVKTEQDYYRVMRGIDKDYNIVDIKKLKKHEPVQMAKIRKIREIGGLALVAYNYTQVKEYVNETISSR